MLSTRFRVLLAVLLLCLPAAALGRGSEDVEGDTILRKIAEKTADIKAFKADFEVSGDQVGMAAMKGTITFQTPDKFRMKGVLGFGNIEQITISDGEWSYILIPAMGSTTKINMKKLRAMLKEAGLPENQQQHNIARPLATLKEGTAKLQSTAKINDQDCWVFRGTPTAQANKATGETQAVEVAVSKADGMTRRIRFLGPENKALMVVDYRNVKANPELDDKFFVYTPPKDAVVMDQTDQVLRMLETFLKAPKPENAE